MNPANLLFFRLCALIPVLILPAAAQTTINTDETVTVTDLATYFGGAGTITMNPGAALQINATNNGPHTISNPFVFSGGAGTINLRCNRNDTTYNFTGAFSSDASGPQTLAITTGYANNGDREEITIDNGLPNATGGSSLSIDVTFGAQTPTFDYVNLKGANTFTGSITLNQGNALPRGYLTVGGRGYKLTNTTVGFTPGSGGLAPNYPGNVALGTATNFVYASSAPQTMAGVISGVGAIHTVGTGALTLSGVNTYTGNTTVNSGGSLVLANIGGLKFVVTNSSSNKVTGAGSATMNGTFTLDTSAVTSISGAWPLVDTTTKSFGGTFGLAGFTGPLGNLYTKTSDGRTWTFDKSTGVLALSSNALITAFGIPGSSGLINQTNKTIALNVPYTPWGTGGMASLAPTFTLTSGTCNQTSGAPPSPTFAAANPATYTVTDGATVHNYIVTVTLAPAGTASTMLTCNFGALGQAAINETAGTVTLTVPPSQSLTSLAPTFTLSANATINPTSGSTQNFTNPVVYRVTAENGVNFKDYTVSVQSFATWAHSGSMFINTTPAGANVTGSVSNFPLLVRLNSGNFNFAQAQSDGRDIRFTTTTGTSLPYQIEQWDAVGGRAAVWVRMPTISGNTVQEIIMYWGKSGVGSLSSGTSVFNSTNGYVSVIHLGDSLTDEIGTTTPSNVGTTTSNGLIGRARTFASGQGILGGNSITGLPTGSGPFSTGVWVRSTTAGKDILGWGLQEPSQKKVVMQLVSPPRINMDCWFGGANVSGSASVGLSEWTYIVHTFQSNGTRLYVNGALDASNSGGSMNIQSNARYYLGGWWGTYNFVGDMDEARISNVVRSADWVKLEYENQKPLQTLIGGIVPGGSEFSVSPTSVTMNEASTTSLTAQAGGAQKVYWIYRKGRQETILATDQLTLNYTSSRVTGNESAVIQLKAVFPAGTQTINVPLTVLDTIPDPAFTLVPSTTSWNGRQSMTVTANLSNLAAMQTAGYGALRYKWSVNGVAVIKQENNGTLTLNRSQGSGPMTVGLTIDNGGTPVSQSTTVTVQEPATDPWLARTPDANEKPVNKQFFARNPETNQGTIFYNGTQVGSPDTVYLKVYKTPSGGSETLDATYRKALVRGSYAFTAPITAGLITYRVVYGTTTSGVDSDLASVTDLVCGDAFIIEGQSNALATDNSAPNDTTTTNKWVRTYGLTLGWNYAIAKGNELRLGVWGWYLANRLVANHNMPICIINAAVGGTRIDQHRPNPAGRGSAGTVYEIYANLYNRVNQAKLSHGIRGLFWHQGEQNQGAGGIDPDYDYKFYQQYFVDISAAWKQDFPNLRNYYIFQIWPAACGDTSRNDQLREVQRTLPFLYSNMKIMSTQGIVPGASCHYEPAGYQVFSDLIGPLVEEDVYGVVPPAPKTAPNLLRAYFTTPAKSAIALVFDQNVAWNPGAPSMLFLANASGTTSGSVSSGSASRNTITLQVSSASSATTITYLKGLVSWQQGNLLYGTNGIAALTFADVAIGLPPVSYDIWAGGVPFDGDSNNDSVKNGVAWVLGAANPAANASGLLPVVAKDGGQWVFEYNRHDDSLPPATTQVVQYGSDLTGWTDIPVQTTSSGAVTITPGTPADRVRVAIPNGGAKMFARLKVTQ